MDDELKEELTRLLSNLMVPTNRRTIEDPGNLEWLARNLHINNEGWMRDRAIILVKKLLRNKHESEMIFKKQGTLFDT